MNCPVCVSERLVMTDRQGVEIDYCPKCRGVWLDRGELDKIIERAAGDAPPARSAAGPAARPTPMPPPAPYRRHDDDDDDDRRYSHGYGYGDPRYTKSSKKKTLLKELFDI